LELGEPYHQNGEAQGDADSGDIQGVTRERRGRGGGGEEEEGEIALSVSDCSRLMKNGTHTIPYPTPWERIAVPGMLEERLSAVGGCRWRTASNRGRRRSEKER